MIATRNRSELLRLCLESLGRQSAAPAAYEVVVVVDGATDGTGEMLSALETPYALKVIEQEPAGSSSARNAGAAAAAGRLLLFVDDDELADPRLVSAHLEAHRGGGRTVVVGAIERRVPERADRFARLGVEDATWQIEQLGQRPATFRDCFGGNCSMPRDGFQAVGGYAADLTRETDTELGYRLHLAGHEFAFAADAVVSEYRTRSWNGIIADAELRGRIGVDLYDRYPGMLAHTPLGGAGELAMPRARRAIEGTLRARRPCAASPSRGGRVPAAPAELGEGLALVRARVVRTGAACAPPPTVSSGGARGAPR